ADGEDGVSGSSAHLARSGEASSRALGTRTWRVDRRSPLAAAATEWEWKTLAGTSMPVSLSLSRNLGRSPVAANSPDGLPSRVAGLDAADVAEEDAVGAHAQAGAHEITNEDVARALGVGRPCLEVDHVRLLELELGRVLDGDDALPVGDERRQNVEVGRLAGA